MLDCRIVLVPVYLIGLPFWAKIEVASCDDMRGAGEFWEDEWA